MKPTSAGRLSYQDREKQREAEKEREISIQVNRGVHIEVSGARIKPHGLLIHCLKLD